MEKGSRKPYVIFLLHYDRPNGKLISITEFPDTQRELAMAARLELELDLHRRGLPHDATLLEAANLEAVKRTHGRYFYSCRELLEQLVEAVERAGKVTVQDS